MTLFLSRLCRFPYSQSTRYSISPFIHDVPHTYSLGASGFPLVVRGDDPGLLGRPLLTHRQGHQGLLLFVNNRRTGQAKTWPAQAIMYKQQVVERALSFAQTLLSRHATCEHLGGAGIGSFQNNQLCDNDPSFFSLTSTDFFSGTSFHGAPWHGARSAIKN